VREALQKRLELIFNEFEEVVVSVSGGKDSTVLFYEAFRVAKKLGRLPINVFWIDQEAEWQSTEDIIKKWMYKKGVRPFWLQIPMKITNATSMNVDFLDCWNPYKEKDWIRPKDKISIKKNTYGTDRFYELFEAFFKKHFGHKKTATLSGVRAEESPARFLGLTAGNTYKGITWGRKYPEKNLKTFYPLYDWSYLDVWKYIYKNNLEYNKVYEAQYKLGTPIKNMRVSNLNHETAVNNLFEVQQIEPNTHNKILNRITGSHAATKAGKTNYFPKTLPYMFKDWREYRNFLLEKLVTNPEHKLGFKKTFFSQDLQFEHFSNRKYTSILKAHVRGILANDWENSSILHNLWINNESEETQKAKAIKKEFLKKTGLWEKLVEEGVAVENKRT